MNPIQVSFGEGGKANVPGNALNIPIHGRNTGGAPAVIEIAKICGLELLPPPGGVSE